MAKLVGAQGSYEQRCRALVMSRIALWDVLKHSVRPGSMDADIRLDTAEVNDFNGFITDHPGIECILFNGKKAEQIFRKTVKLGASIECVSLPSTSPAYAAMSFGDKLDAWRTEINKGRHEE